MTEPTSAEARYGLKNPTLESVVVGTGIFAAMLAKLSGLLPGRGAAMGLGLVILLHTSWILWARPVLHWQWAAGVALLFGGGLACTLFALG